jgi:hypothetical protein
MSEALCSGNHKGPNWGRHGDGTTAGNNWTHGASRTAREGCTEHNNCRCCSGIARRHVPGTANIETYNRRSAAANLVPSPLCAGTLGPICVHCSIIVWRLGQMSNRPLFNCRRLPTYLIQYLHLFGHFEFLASTTRPAISAEY